MSRQICIPVIDPPSGRYRPPLSVRCHGEVNKGEELWITITSAEKKIRQLYKGPCLLSDCGRARVTAFVRRPGIGDGPEATAIFELSDDALPQGRALVVAASTDVSQVASVATLQVPRLKFDSVPAVLHSLRPVDITLSLCDTSGAPAGLSNLPESAVVVLDIPEKGAVLTCKARVAVLGAPAPLLAPSFFRVRDAFFVKESDNTFSVGKTSASLSGIQESLAITESKIGVLSNSEGCGIQFRIVNSCKGLIGLDGKVGLNGEIDVGCDYAFHFSGDMSDVDNGIYKISEKRDFSASAQTYSYEIGDRFALRLRQTGEVDFLHNDRVVYTSRKPVASEHMYCCVVKIAEQGAFPCISQFGYIPRRVQQQLVVPSLLYNGVAAKGILRVWLFGEMCDPAMAEVRLCSASVPKWAFSTFSVACMFATGAVGGDGTQIIESMTSLQSASMQLFQLKDRLGGGDTSVQPSTRSGSLDTQKRQMLDSVFDS